MNFQMGFSHAQEDYYTNLIEVDDCPPAQIHLTYQIIELNTCQQLSEKILPKSNLFNEYSYYAEFEKQRKIKIDPSYHTQNYQFIQTKVNYSMNFFIKKENECKSIIGVGEYSNIYATKQIDFKKQKNLFRSLSDYPEFEKLQKESYESDNLPIDPSLKIQYDKQTNGHQTLVPPIDHSSKIQNDS